MEQLGEVLKTRVLPYLGLAELQSLRQACRGTKCATERVPAGRLWQLAQV